MIYQGFIGPTTKARSRQVDAEWAVNLFLEHLPGTPKRDPSYYGRPVLRPWSSCAPGPIRGIFFQDGVLLVVSGQYVYRIPPSRMPELLGEVAVDPTPVTFATNGVGGNQYALTSGGFLYVYDTEAETFEVVTSENVPTPCTSIAFADGFGIAQNAEANTFAISALEDFTTWSGLDVMQTSLTSDNKIALSLSHREAWLFGSKNTEVWRNVGDADTPWQPVDGVLIEHGIAAPFSVQRVDNTLYWLGQDETGTGIVWRANGYTPQRVSDHATETTIARWTNIQNTTAFVLSIEGHAWYLLQNPSSLTTLVYDLTSQTWVDFAQWDNRLMTYVPFIGSCQAFGFGKQLIGSRAIPGLYSGVIYSFEMNPADGLWQDKLCWPLGA